MSAFTIWYTISLTVSLSSFPSGALCKTSRSVYCISSNTMNTWGSLLLFLVVFAVFWEKLVSSLMMFGWPWRSLRSETSLSAIRCAYYDKLEVKVIRLNKKIFLQTDLKQLSNFRWQEKIPPAICMRNLTSAERIEYRISELTYESLSLNCLIATIWPVDFWRAFKTIPYPL